MQVRLGFAVAAHMEPDVLLVDEVLAVGDQEFQAKCLAHVRELLEQGCAMILVAHDLELVRRHCRRAILLRGGQVAAAGEAGGVIAAYRGETAP